MLKLWTPRVLVCRVCGETFALHKVTQLQRHIESCVERNADFVDAFRPAQAPFEGDPELVTFAAAEGDVYNRRPGTRKRPR